MRLLPALVALSILGVPLASGGTATGGAAGVNGGYLRVGLWDLFEYRHYGGVATITLDWSTGLVPFGANYDLHLYPPGALDDHVLDEPPIAVSKGQGTSPAHEEIVLPLAPADYVIAVVPTQAQEETYTLRADPGFLTVLAPSSPGFEVVCPFPGPCLPFG